MAIAPEVIDATAKHGWLALELGGESGDEGEYVLSAERLRAETARVLECVKSSANDFIYLISERVETPRGIIDHESTGGASVTIDGVPYMLFAGFNLCALRPALLDPQTGLLVQESIDVRNREVITDDSGHRLKIRKKRAAGPAVRWLSRLLKKTTQWAGDVRVDVA